jgi:hypothetical protein
MRIREENMIKPSPASSGQEPRLAAKKRSAADVQRNLMHIYSKGVFFAGLRGNRGKSGFLIVSFLYRVSAKMQGMSLSGPLCGNGFSSGGGACRLPASRSLLRASIYK